MPSSVRKLESGPSAPIAISASSSRPSRFGDASVLRRYERRRRSDNAVAAAFLDGVERAPALLRAAALGVAGRVPPLRRALIDRALGMAGDVPAFLKGGRS
jgi:2-polyprenyl-6-methoxyphenol hydroxylase-like FAD-dependent oxidoreductase